jgi:hypothetical protein
LDAIEVLYVRSDTIEAFCFMFSRSCSFVQKGRVAQKDQNSVPEEKGKAGNLAKSGVSHVTSSQCWVTEYCTTEELVGSCLDCSVL